LNVLRQKLHNFDQKETCTENALLRLGKCKIVLDPPWFSPACVHRLGSALSMKGKGQNDKKRIERRKLHRVSD
jgi:hypothetical protein